MLCYLGIDWFIKNIRLGDGNLLHLQILYLEMNQNVAVCSAGTEVRVQGHEAAGQYLREGKNLSDEGNIEKETPNLFTTSL